ncbi:M57 family metalloprotease [Fulvivirga sp. M361]|uniref:M57 family metalloprotease n=1 Tax=Fulvivirga sp. M361 TaxID=2594266 RepID=UPI00162698A1|nr:M57 family metalloprotease [Fulvivirga sp. M361]
MKNVNLKLASASAAIVFFGLTACNDAVDVAPPDNVISDEVKEQFTSLGFDVSDITTTDGMEKLDPQNEGGKYLLEGDIVVSQKDLDNMLSGDYVNNGEPKLEQYRTTNLVSQNRTINVIGFTGSGINGLDSKMRTALQQAVDNFNALNINLTFTLTFGTNFNPFDIVVYRVSGGGGGSAGFPSGGAPFKWVQIQSGTSNFSTDVVEHVITHEIGHCVGLRHTDYFNRSISCGRGGNEGQAGVGAIHIPGTPTSADLNSIMLACFSSNENGEFGQFDRIALETLY